MKNVLYKLYHGEIEPHNMAAMDPPLYKEKEKEYYTNRDSFEKKLPKELVAEFEKLADLEGDLLYEHELNAFRKGFKLGMQFTVEGMRN